MASSSRMVRRLRSGICTTGSSARDESAWASRVTLVREGTLALLLGVAACGAVLALPLLLPRRLVVAAAAAAAAAAEAAAAEAAAAEAEVTCSIAGSAPASRIAGGVRGFSRKELSRSGIVSASWKLSQ